MVTRRSPALAFEGLAYLAGGPGKVLFRDDKRRGEADDEIVGLFAEQAQILQPLAVGARGHQEFDPDEQAAAADGFDMGMAKFAQFIEQPRAEFGGTIG